MWTCTHEARPENDIGTILNDRLHQHRKLLRIVFEVGVLNYHHIACGMLETGAKSRAFALIYVVVNNLIDLVRN